MTADKLHDAIGLLPADLVAETDRKRSGKPKVISWKRYAALAACFVLVLSAGRFALLLAAPRGAGTTESAAAMDMPAAAAPMEAAPEAPAADVQHDIAAAVPAQPPVLTVSGKDASISVSFLSLDWEVPQEDGTTQATRVDAPVPEDTFDSCEGLEAKDGRIVLAWQLLPDSVTFRSWHRDGEAVIADVWEGGNALLPDGQGGYALPAAEGTRLYEITAHWPQGWAAYTFRVTAP